MTAILLTTRLKVSDPTALTALATLRDRLGFADIGGLRREEAFLFEVDAGSAEAVQLVDDLARRTNLFLNPNKHVYRIWTGSEAIAQPVPETGRAPARAGNEPAAGAADRPLRESRPASAAREPAEPGTPEAWILIWTPGDGDEFREALWRHVGSTNVSAVRRGWFWRFVPAPGASLKEFHREVSESLILRSRTQGFLVNPAYQETRLYDRRPTVYDTREALLPGGTIPVEA